MRFFNRPKELTKAALRKLERAEAKQKKEELLAEAKRKKEAEAAEAKAKLEKERYDLEEATYYVTVIQDLKASLSSVTAVNRMALSGRKNAEKFYSDLVKELKFGKSRFLEFESPSKSKYCVLKSTIETISLVKSGY